MSEKYLPIKIFEKRKDYDDRATEGGGKNREPGFTLHGEELQKHSLYLTSSIHVVRSQFAEEISKGRNLPMVLATSLNESAIAKTHRGRVIGALESDGNDNVVGIYGDRKILSILQNSTVLDNLEKLINKEEEAVLTSSLDEIEFFHPSVDPYEDGHMEYRMRLFDYNDYDRNHLARRLFEALCNKINVQIQSFQNLLLKMTCYQKSNIDVKIVLKKLIKVI